MIINTVEYTENGGFLVNKDLTPDSQGQMSIPDAMSNRHRRKLQIWLDAGNTPDPFVPPIKTWQELRAEAYLPIEDQMDMLYWDQVNGTTTYKDHRATVKATHVKP